MALAAALTFVTFMVLTASVRQEAARGIGGAAVGAMALFFLASMLIGWLSGGPARSTRQIVATATSMRNAALCLLMAESSPSGDAVLAPLTAFSLLMVPPNALFTIYNAIRARRAASDIATRPAEPSRDKE
ncbi:MAG: hypothetical protein ACREX9_19810 [Gammaproteobacteria bacterium]